MKKHLSVLSAVVTFICVFSNPASAVNQWVSGTISTVESVGGGGFVVSLSGWTDPACSSNPAGIYVYSGNNGVFADGVKSMLAVALTAAVSGKTVSILYDNSGSTGPAGLCWGNSLELNL